MSKDKAPPELEKSRTYADWRKLIVLWTNYTSLTKSKQGSAIIFSSLPTEAQEACLELTEDVINAENGATKVLERLDELYKKDTLIEKIEAIDAYENFSRPVEMDIKKYIIEFEKRYTKIKNYGSTVSDDLLAYRLLQRANLSKSSNKLLRATAEFKFDAMKAKLKSLFLNESSTSTMTNEIESINLMDDVTNEVVYEEYYAQQHPPSRINEEYYAQQHPSRYNNNRGASARGGRNRGGYRGTGRGNQRGNYRGGNRGTHNHPVTARDSTRGGRSGVRGRSVNVADSSGTPTQCHYCKSIYHYEYQCPDKVHDTLFTSTENVDNIILYESDHDNPKGLLVESWNCAVLDCGSGKTVCGEKWLDVYTDSLSEDEKKKIEYGPPESRYRFGDGVVIPSFMHVKLPAFVGEHPVFLESDVVKNDIPVLLSRESMAKADMSLIFKDDTLIAYDQTIHLPVSKTGHYLLPLTPPVQAIREKAVEYDIYIASDIQSKKNKARHLHRQFAHPPAEKLNRFLNAAGEPWASDNELKKEITKVSDNCRTCLEYSKAPARPIVGFPMAVRFLECVAMDLKFYDNKILLHLIDNATRLSISVRIPSKKPPAVLDALFKHFIAIFGSVDKFLTDNGGEFVNPEFVELCEKFNINVKTTPAESPWSNGMVERHNAIIAGMLDKILADTPCNFDIALAWCINAKNSMINVHGFTPYQLAFGKNPKLPASFDNLPPANGPVDHSKLLMENLSALHAAREAFTKLENSERLKRALAHNVRTTNENRFVTGDVVFYKRESDRHWKGKATVLGQDGKQVLLKHGGYYVRCHPCRVALDRDFEESLQNDVNNQIRNNENDASPTTPTTTPTTVMDSDSDDDEHINNNPADLPAEADIPAEDDTHDLQVETDSDDPSIETDDTTTEAPVQENESTIPKTTTEQLSKGMNIHVKFFGDDAWYDAFVVRRTGKVGGRYGNCWDIVIENEHFDVDFDTEISHWEVNPTSTAAITSTQFNVNSVDELIISDTLVGETIDAVAEAKEKELSTLIAHDVYEEVDDVGQECISSRWVITEKVDEVSQSVTVKARLCARGFEEEQNFRTDSPTCSRESVRILLGTLASKQWELSSIDITRAFLQGEAIERTVFLKPPPEAKTDKLWRLKKCLYGLADGPRKWYLKLTGELKRLGCSQHKIDKGLFYYVNKDKLESVITCCVDDIAYGNTPLFLSNILTTLKKTFNIGTYNTTAFKYVGISISQNEDYSISVHQINYINTLQMIPISSSRRTEKHEPVTEDERKHFRRAIGQLNWAAGISRPDISFAVCQLSTRVNGAVVSDLIEVNKLIKYVQTEPLTITYPKLDINSLHLTLYCDASFKNLPDGGSQGGHIVFLCDDHDNCCPIAWSSSRIKRIVHSTLAAETLSLTDGSGTALFVLSLLEGVVPCREVISVLTDNRSLYETCHSKKPTTDKRLRIDIAGIKEMIDLKQIEITAIPGKEQLADVLTKKGASPHPLLSVLRNGKF